MSPSFGIRPTEYTLQIWASGSARKSNEQQKTTPPWPFFKEGQEYFENDRVKMAGMLEQYARKTKSFPATTEELRAVLAEGEWSGTICAIPGDIPISVCSASNPDTAIPIESAPGGNGQQIDTVPITRVARIIVCVQLRAGRGSGRSCGLSGGEICFAADGSDGRWDGCIEAGTGGIFDGAGGEDSADGLFRERGRVARDRA